ncbi:MAG TPA: hypothetical protein PKI94_05945 [Candidatus Gastranaerophilaceae bacterium]|nr:hypothetical protein [Candidatus Gastranaerophilaceae bacterium]
MGMAASQARYLSLTARKSNVEYEGQQINQQRTNLANQSATLNRQLLDLSVPTPPSVSAYAQTQYSITMNGENCNITNLFKKPGGLYNVSYTYQDTNTMIVPSSQYSVTGSSGSYSIGGVALVLVPSGSEAETQLNDAAQIGNGPYYSYTATNGAITYFSQADIDAAIAANDQTQGYIPQEFEYEHEAYLEDVTVTFSGDQPVSITLSNGTQISMNATSNVNEQEYDTAMTQYEYNKAQYEKQMEDINSKLSIIQQQDKTLELKLKQADTEHNAIQTEIEAVQKVIGKNIESSFKTFGNG